MAADLKLGDGWLILKKALDPKLDQALLEKYVGKATAANAQIARKEIRSYIKEGAQDESGGVYVAALTNFIKHDPKPIIGTPGADMFNSIVGAQLNWRQAVVGVKRTSKLQNIAEVVHNGKTIKVTEKMRNMFRLLWLVSIGKMDKEKLTERPRQLYDWATKGGKKSSAAFKKWGPGKNQIIIPARPFITKTLEKTVVKKQIEKTWNDAVKYVVKQMAKGGE